MPKIGRDRISAPTNVEMTMFYIRTYNFKMRACLAIFLLCRAVCSWADESLSIPLLPNAPTAPPTAAQNCTSPSAFDDCLNCVPLLKCCEKAALQVEAKCAAKDCAVDTNRRKAYCFKNQSQDAGEWLSHSQIEKERKTQEPGFDDVKKQFEQVLKPQGTDATP